MSNDDDLKDSEAISDRVKFKKKETDWYCGVLFMFLIPIVGLIAGGVSSCGVFFDFSLPLIKLHFTDFLITLFTHSNLTY